MNLDLQHKNALVCGGSKGIGKASAIELALLGANVTILARNEDRMMAVVAQLDISKGQKHHFLSVDFSDIATLKTRVATLLIEQNYHILINNTGGPPAGTILSATPEAFLSAYHNHLICNHLIATSLVEGMKKDGYGRIINIISTSVKQPLEGLGVSNTTRAAVAGWAKTLSNELAPFGITVNNVLPGATRTERLEEIIVGGATKNNISIETVERNMKKEIPMARFAAAEEVAAAVAFLASPAAAYITGISVPVDGGRIKGL
ncbi:MAG: 4-formylbenzenesulfonate dehydrogenase TsaC1/TsaC2 [Bacteroidota bacterium]